MNVIYALTKDAILSLEKNSLINYLHIANHPADTPEQIEKMLNIYSVTMEAFPLNQKAGTIVGCPDKTVTTLPESRQREVSAYYIVNPSIARDSVAE